MRPRGARPSPRHKLLSATPHRIVGATPPQWLWLPSTLSFWGNQTYGDCVSAEEAFAKACHSPEIFIPENMVINWARTNGFLNGSYLPDVMAAMQAGGFQPWGVTYDDGPYTGVDWTNEAVLQNAISIGPVKIGVASDQLENVVPDPPSNGWLATGFQNDQNLDHCVSLCGYGPMGWLASQLGGSIPDSAAPGYAMFTWSSVGIIDQASVLAITGEAWLRTPTTVAKWQG